MGKKFISSSKRSQPGHKIFYTFTSQGMSPLTCMLSDAMSQIFLKLYGNIGNFNQQGLEKYNDIVSKDYFRSSNHRGVEALRQIMLKKNRIQHLEARGAERVKNSYLCSNCKMQGHSITRCIEKCSSCDALICSTHLLKIDGKWSKKCLVTT